MKKAIYINIVAVLSLMSQFVLADRISSSENKEGMYYCTKDLQKLEFSAVSSNKSVGGYANEYIQVSKDDDLSHTFLRHCFIIFAEEIAITRDNSANGFGEKILFRIIDSLGYGIDRDEDKYGTVAGEQWLLVPEERNKYTVSCTKIMREGDLKEGGDYVNVMDLLKAYKSLSNDMREDSLQEPYNLLKHNCCSVAYNNVVKNPYFKKEDVLTINKRGYNVLGTGIKFEWTTDDLLQIIKGSMATPGDLTKSSFISSSKVSSYVVASVASLFEGKEKIVTSVSGNDVNHTSENIDVSLSLSSKDKELQTDVEKASVGNKDEISTKIDANSTTTEEDL